MNKFEEMIISMSADNKKITVATPITKVAALPDLSNDPYFVEKGRKADEFLKKNGFPKELLDRR